MTSSQLVQGLQGRTRMATPHTTAAVIGRSLETHFPLGRRLASTTKSHMWAGKKAISTFLTKLLVSIYTTGNFLDAIVVAFSSPWECRFHGKCSMEPANRMGQNKF
jgi:hypothetical protein